MIGCTDGWTDRHTGWGLLPGTMKSHYSEVVTEVMIKSFYSHQHMVFFFQKKIISPQKIQPWPPIWPPTTSKYFHNFSTALLAEDCPCSSEAAFEAVQSCLGSKTCTLGQYPPNYHVHNTQMWWGRRQKRFQPFVISAVSEVFTLWEYQAIG